MYYARGCMHTSEKREPATIVRQVRFTPKEWARIKEKADSLRVAYAKYIAYATLRSLGPVDSADLLASEITKLQELQMALNGVGGAGTGTGT